MVLVVDVDNILLLVVVLVIAMDEVFALFVIMEAAAVDVSSINAVNQIKIVAKIVFKKYLIISQRFLTQKVLKVSD